MCCGWLYKLGLLKNLESNGTYISESGYILKLNFLYLFDSGAFE